MAKADNQDLEFPFYDPNPRRVLSAYSKEVKEESIKDGPYNEEQIEASPPMLALTIMLMAQDHLNLILDSSSKKIGIQISKEQKAQLYLELLSLYYFLVGEQVGKYLHEDQFTLFALKLHVELLDTLPQTRDTWWLFGINPLTRPKKIKEIVGEDSWKMGLSRYIHKGERFYIQDKLNNEEVKAINELKPLLLGEHVKDYEKNLMTQFLVKSFYFLSKTLNLSLPENLVAVIGLYVTNSPPILESQQVFRNIKPVWHHKTG